MRLRDMHAVLDWTVSRLSVDATQEGYPGGNGYRLRKLATVRKALDAIQENVPALSGQAATLRKHDFFSAGYGENPLFKAQDVEPFLASLGQFQNDAGRLHALLGAVLTAEPVNSASLRLPPVSDLKELSSVADEFSEILEQALLTAKAGHYRIAGYDVGSINVTLDFTSPAGLVLILTLADIARDYLKFRREVAAKRDLAEAAARAEAKEAEKRAAEGREAEKKATEKNAAQADVMKAQIEAVFDLVLKQKLSELMSGVAPQVAEYEGRKRLETSVIRLGTLMERGAAVTPSLSAPKEIMENYRALAMKPPEPEPKQLVQGEVSPDDAAPTK